MPAATFNRVGSKFTDCVLSFLTPSFWGLFFEAPVFSDGKMSGFRVGFWCTQLWYRYRRPICKSHIVWSPL